MKLTGNTILITGAGSGIGLAMAEEFKKLGNEVIVAARSVEKLEAAAQKGLKGELGDVSDAASIKELAKNVIEKYPALNVVIHNAGISRPENLRAGGDEAGAEAIIATNILGPMRLTNALLPHLLKQEDAVVMTVSSGLGFAPLALAPTYSASKAAIHSYTESLRYQLKGTSVQVIELPPPYVQTGLSGEFQKTDPYAMPLDEFTAEVFKLLKENPESNEILVERVREMRFAAEKGYEGYQAYFNGFNDLFAEARKQEVEELMS
jgi:uncharacterized oxidoreductase